MRIAVVACGLCIAAQPLILVEVEAFRDAERGIGSPEGCAGRLRWVKAVASDALARVTEKSRGLNDRTGR